MVGPSGSDTHDWPLLWVSLQGCDNQYVLQKCPVLTTSKCDLTDRRCCDIIMGQDKKNYTIVERNVVP